MHAAITGPQVVSVTGKVGNVPAEVSPGFVDATLRTSMRGSKCRFARRLLSAHVMATSVMSAATKAQPCIELPSSG